MPHVKIPTPMNCPFEDFAYMAAPIEDKPIRYLRRSTSICGQRNSKNFTKDIPAQLRQFSNVVLEHSKGKEGHLQKMKMAEGFVVGKLTQYLHTLEKIPATNSHPNIDQAKGETLKGYMLKQIDEANIKSLNKLIITNVSAYFGGFFGSLSRSTSCD